MAADRMAARRGGAPPILVRPPSRRHIRRAAGRTAPGRAASPPPPPSASPLTTDWAPSGRRFPPQDQVTPRSCRNLPFPIVIDPAAPPIRPERHIPNSIATLRRRLTVALARSLDRCPCCNAPRRPVSHPSL